MLLSKMFKRRITPEIVICDSDELAHLNAEHVSSEEVFSDEVRMAVYASNELNIIDNAKSDDPSTSSKEFSS